MTTDKGLYPGKAVDHLAGGKWIWCVDCGRLTTRQGDDPASGAVRCVACQTRRRELKRGTLHVAVCAACNHRFEVRRNVPGKVAACYRCLGGFGRRLNLLSRREGIFDPETAVEDKRDNAKI